MPYTPSFVCVLEASFFSPGAQRPSVVEAGHVKHSAFFVFFRDVFLRRDSPRPDVDQFACVLA